MTKYLTLLLLLLSSNIVLADSWDEAEAKKRGISVEAVQIEKLKVQNAELAANVKNLEAENARLKEQMKTTKGEPYFERGGTAGVGRPGVK